MDQQAQLAAAFNNVVNTSASDDKRISKHKKTVNWLGKFEQVISLFIFCCGVAQICLSGYRRCREDQDYYYSDCGWHETIGQGVWCSVLPFVAGVFGVLSSSKTATKTKINTMMFFCILGAISMPILIIIELSLFASPGSTFRTLQTMNACAGGVNFILLIISASYSCYLSKCCGCHQEPTQIVYVNFDGNQVRLLQSGASIGTQQNTPYMVTMNSNRIQPVVTYNQLPVMVPQYQVQPQPAVGTSDQLPAYEASETKTLPTSEQE